MKLLENLKNKLKNRCASSSEELVSWIKWIKNYCNLYACCSRNCRYYNPENNVHVCKIPTHILYMGVGELPEDVQPQEPPENVLDILNGVDLDEIIDFQ